MKNIIIFHLKINIFTAVKYCCILHGRVCLMKVMPTEHEYGFANTVVPG